MNYYLFLTALTVSIDSFLCGLSLSMSKGKRFSMAIVITLTVFIMCSITNYATYLFDQHLTEKTASLGGLILITVGLYNLFKKDTNKKIPNKQVFIQAMSIGFAVGLDGALANLSLSIMGNNQIYVPIIIALMHGAMISLSIILSQTKIAQKICKLTFIAPVILICLGIYKTIGFFI